jgi:hypothetical protein
MRYMVAVILTLVAITWVGCDQQAPDDDVGKVPLEVRQAEAMDDSRLDASADSLASDSSTPDQDTVGSQATGGN